MPTNRRKFIRNISTGILAIGSGIPLSMCKNSNYEHLTILHTNDLHSQIDPFPKDHPKFYGMGGLSRIAEKINEIRKSHPNVLLLDAGDFFQGSPYFNFYKGELEIKLMNKMGYDASTFGNHEFDNGIEELAQQISKADFPFLNCNYDLSKTPLQNLHQPYKIIKKGKTKIGITGIGIDLNGLADPSNIKNLRYTDPMSKAEETASHLKNRENCNLVICLSHLGYKYKSDKISDIFLANNTKNIDIIIGGHTHTFMDKPDMITNRHNKQVIVHQVGWGGLRLGVLQLKIPLNKETEPELFSPKIPTIS